MKHSLNMSGLAVLLAASSIGLTIRADANVIETLRAERLELQEAAQAIQDVADGEKRDLTEDEQKQIDEIFARFEKLGDDIARRERISANAALLAGTPGRRTEPEATQAAARTARVPAAAVNQDDRGKWGWRTFGDFAAAVRVGSRNGAGRVDPRLVSDAATSYGSEGTDADGGFAVPPDFREEIMKKVMGEDALLSRTDLQVSSSNSITYPIDETTPWAAAGGIQATWAGEGSQLTQSKPALDELKVPLHKLTALVPMTEELLEDARATDAYLRGKVPQVFTSKVNLAIVQGTGTGQPLGILGAPATVEVAKEVGQAAASVVFDNLTKMWGRLYAPCRANAVWLINQDVEEKLMGLSFPGTGTAVPVFIPAGGLADSPYARLFGRPIIPTEACETLGDKGDIILTDLSKYLAARKSTGMRTDTSMHLFFDQDITAFRFIFRLGGRPWHKAPIARRDGSKTLSSTVVLGARA